MSVAAKIMGQVIPFPSAGGSMVPTTIPVTFGTDTERRVVIGAVESSSSALNLPNLAYRALPSSDALFIRVEENATIEVIEEADNVKKLLPDKKNIGRMLDSLSSDEQKEFLHELLNLNIGMFSGNAVAYQEELRRVILAWEYTVAVKTNPDFLATMENSIEEALNCPPEECVDWRTLLEG